MATKNVVPRAASEGKVGTSTKPWAEVNADAVNVGGSPVASTASPSFTGTPTAPTATSGTNTTQLASTAFVQAALAALSADVAGPASSVDSRIAAFDGTTGKLLKDGGSTIADVVSRANHTGTQLLATISDAGTAAALDVPAAGDAASGEVVKGNDSRLTDSRTPSTHASTHIKGGGDAIDADKLQIDVSFSTISADTSDPNVTDSDHLGAILKGIDNALTSGGTYTDENARDAIGAALSGGDTNSINCTPDDAGDTISLDVQRKSVGLVGNTEGSLGEDAQGIFVELGTTSNKAASGQDSRFPTGDEKAALAGTDGTPSSSNKFVTNTDSRLADSRTPSAHASTHSRGGSDPIDGDTIDIDWNPTNYTPSTSPTEVTNVDELTAHLYGIDQALASRVLNTWGVSGTSISASNKVLDADVPSYTLASPVTGDWIPFYDTGSGAMRRANFSSFGGGGGGSGPDAGAASELTISALGAVAVTGNHHYIDTYSDAATDDLETLGGSPADGDIVYLYAANDARTVVIKHNAGDIYCWGGSDVTLDADNKAAVAIYSALYSRWMVLGGGGGGASLPVDDTTALVYDTGDSTAKVRLDAGLVTTATTRVLQAPDGDAKAALFTIEREYDDGGSMSSGTENFFLVARRAMTVTDMDIELNGAAGDTSAISARLYKNNGAVGSLVTANQTENGTSVNISFGTASQGVSFAQGDTLGIYLVSDGSTGSPGTPATGPWVASITGFYAAT
jgi:hypothetical protein